MARDNETLATQERIFRIAQRQMTLKAISLDSDIPYNTLRSYAGSGCATAEMPVSALRKLIGVIPDELLSLLLPEGRVIVQAPDELDHDAIEDACRDLLETKGRAHHENSPAGRDISDCEREALGRKVVSLRAKVAA